MNRNTYIQTFTQIAKQMTALRRALEAEGNEPDFINGICAAYIQTLAACVYAEQQAKATSVYTPKQSERRES